jgi:hypothetical protein
MNKATMKSRATLIGKVLASKGITLTRAEQLNVVAQLEGARDWHHACNENPPEEAKKEDARAFDALQLEAAQAYCSGDFSHMTHYRELDHAGDSLFTFVIHEIHDADGDRTAAARMLRTAAEQLEAVADYMENLTGQPPAASPQADEIGKSLDHPVTISNGSTSVWKIRFISNRFCEPVELSKKAPDLDAWVQQHPEDMARMLATCHEELSFVIELNGRRGVLYEVEIETTESEGLNENGKNRCNVSEALRRIQLKHDISDLEKKHPSLQWAVGGPENIWNDRLAVWAFCPESTLFTPDAAKSLTTDLFDKFY